MTTDNLKQINITTMSGKPEMYIDGLVILDKINSVYFEGAIYWARNNEIVTSSGRQSIVSLVQRGLPVYYLS